MYLKLKTSIVIAMLATTAFAGGELLPHLQNSDNARVRRIVAEYPQKNQQAKLVEYARQLMVHGFLYDDAIAGTIIWVENEFQSKGEARLLQLAQGIDPNQFREHPTAIVNPSLVENVSRVAASRIRDFLLEASDENYFARQPMDDRLALLAHVLNTTRDTDLVGSGTHRRINKFDVALSVRRLGTDTELIAALRFLLESVDTTLKDVAYPFSANLRLSSQGSPRLTYQTSEESAGLAYAASQTHKFGARGLLAALQERSQLIRLHAATYAYLVLGLDEVSEIESLTPEEKRVVAQAMIRDIETRDLTILASALRALGDIGELDLRLEAGGKFAGRPLTASETQTFYRLVERLSFVKTKAAPAKCRKNLLDSGSDKKSVRRFLRFRAH